MDSTDELIARLEAADRVSRQRGYGGLSLYGEAAAALKARQTTPVSPEDACERLPVGPTMAESKKAMDALTDFLVEDLMSMSDEEILAEVMEDGSDPGEIVRQVRANVEKLITRRRS